MHVILTFLSRDSFPCRNLNLRYLAHVFFLNVHVRQLLNIDVTQEYIFLRKIVRLRQCVICSGSEEERVVQEATLSVRVRIPEGNVTHGQPNRYYYQLGTDIILWYIFYIYSINILYLLQILISQIEHQKDK